MKTRGIFCSLLLIFVTFADSAYSSADDDNRWSRLMYRACLAESRFDFEQSKKLSEEAEAESLKLGNEQQLLSRLLLGALAEEVGDYALAKSWYSKAIMQPDSDLVALNLMDVLEKAGYHDEASELRKKTNYFKANEYLAGAKCMPYIQSEIRRVWTAKLGTPLQGGWSRVVFVMGPQLPHPVGYIPDSSGDELHDNASLTAMKSLRLAPISDNLKRLMIVDFSFDTNDLSTAPETLGKMNPRDAHSYNHIKDLVVWQEKKLGTNHPEVACNMVRGAQVLAQSSETKAAESVLKKAIELWENNKIVCSSTCAAYQQYGDVLLKNKNYDEALPVLRKALNMVLAFSGPDSKEVSDCRTSLITALKKTHHNAEAKDVEKQLKTTSGATR